VIEEDELELELSRLKDLRRLGDDFHSIPGRCEAGKVKAFFSSLLDDTEPAGPEWNKPSVMTEGGDLHARSLGCIEDHLTSLNLNL
jgi:hypothetical protein